MLARWLVLAVLAVLVGGWFLWAWWSQVAVQPRLTASLGVGFVVGAGVMLWRFGRFRMVVDDVSVGYSSGPGGRVRPRFLLDELTGMELVDDGRLLVLWRAEKGMSMVQIPSLLDGVRRELKHEIVRRMRGEGVLLIRLDMVSPVALRRVTEVFEANRLPLGHVPFLAA